jgi:hypothetical protein
MDLPRLGFVKHACADLFVDLCGYQMAQLGGRTGEGEQPTRGRQDHLVIGAD